MTFESYFFITISQYTDLTGLSEPRASNQGLTVLDLSLYANTMQS